MRWCPSELLDMKRPSESRAGILRSLVAIAVISLGWVVVDAKLRNRLPPPAAVNAEALFPLVPCGPPEPAGLPLGALKIRIPAKNCHSIRMSCRLSSTSIQPRSMSRPAFPRSCRHTRQHDGERMFPPRPAPAHIMKKPPCLHTGASCWRFEWRVRLYPDLSRSFYRLRGRFTADSAPAAAGHWPAKAWLRPTG